MTTKAWHLRQDGKAFPIQVHIYPMQDGDLCSEAEVAAFLIKTQSKDQDLARYVLDAWMALLIENSVSYGAKSEDIEAAITSAVNSLPYKFAYPLSTSELLSIHRLEGRYNDIESLYDFIDEVQTELGNIHFDISQTFNQQFCRVRIGGKYNSDAGNNGIWFRIGSVNYNWSNTIYMFVADNRRKLNIESVTVCRDPEADAGYSAEDIDYFYKAKDGSVYYQMPVDEFLNAEHESSPVFSATSINAGVLTFIRSELSRGATMHQIYMSIESHIKLSSAYTPVRIARTLYNQEIGASCIKASEWSDGLNTRTGAKVGKIKRMIHEEFPELTIVDVDCVPRANTKGKMVGFEMIFTLESEIEAIDHLELSVASTKALADTLAETVVRLFRVEYKDYIRFSGISVPGRNY